MTGSYAQNESTHRELIQAACQASFPGDAARRAARRRSIPGPGVSGPHTALQAFGRAPHPAIRSCGTILSRAGMDRDPSGRGARMGRWWKIALAVACALPAVVFRFSGARLDPAVAIAVFGCAVVASAFLLVWAGEAAHHDIAGSLATAILAVIAVLPEYAVDLYFAFTAAKVPQNAHYAAANMTGSNRLLLGLGWPFVALLFAFGLRRRGERPRGVELGEGRRTELFFLGAASIYSLVIPITRRLAWYDAVALLSLFFAYLWVAARGEHSEPDLVGTAKYIGDLPRKVRRTVIVALFVLAAFLVLLAAEPLAGALVEGGKALGVDEFLLVQWLAPIASESPELLVAG